MDQEPAMISPLFAAEDLVDFSTRALHREGLSHERAKVVSDVLVASDLMGHTTHGLQLLGPYLKELRDGGMAKEGEPVVIRDGHSAVTWDGKKLPGPWLVHRALDLALERIAEHPVFTMVIRKSHHIACLAAFLERATEKGLMMILACGDPANKTVAPFGAMEGVYSPDPIGVGIPTESGPVLIDISASATANGVVAQKFRTQSRLPHPWLLDGLGLPTDDPAKAFDDPPATVLPLGGMDLGYKGFGLALMIEALTFGLGGFGRADEPEGWMSGVFMQLIDPEAFGGRASMLRETSFLAAACRSAKPLPGGAGARMPGDRARQLREKQLAEGVRLHPLVWKSMQKVAENYGMNLPDEKKA